MIKKHFRGSPPAEVLAPAVENAAVPEQPVPEPALTDAEAVMLEHEGQTELFVTHAEAEEPNLSTVIPKARCGDVTA